MGTRILIVTATVAEAGKLASTRGSSDVEVLVTGPGGMATSWAMMNRLLRGPRPDIAVNAGIAGSFRDYIGTGEVVQPVADCFADSGVEDGENFLTLAEAGLADKDAFPFRNGFIEAHVKYTQLFRDILAPVRAVTVNSATGSEGTKNRIVRKYNPDIETMEGATFFYICALSKIPFLAIRSVSNLVELRDKSKWNIPLALERLSEKVNEVIHRLK